MSKKVKLSAIAPTENELSFRNKRFKDLSSAFNCRLKCTCCFKDVKNEILRKEKVYIHPFFQVLVCKSCLKFYGNGYISSDEDGSDKYCRWCSEGGSLYVCSECPVSICKSCLKRNMNRSVWTEVEKDDWKCYNCSPKPLYEQRAIAWALKTHFKLRKPSAEKRETEVVPKDEGSLHGHLLNGLDMGLSSIKVIQKHIRGLDLKLGGLSRRKEVNNRNDITCEIVNKITGEILTHLSSHFEKIKEFKENISSFSAKFTSVLDRLTKEEAKCLNSEKRNEAPSTSKRTHSSDDDSIHKRNKDDSSCDESIQEVPVVNGDKSDSPAKENLVCEPDIPNNEDWAIIKPSNEEEEEKQSSLSEGKFPKLNLLRIRKVDEVNKLMIPSCKKSCSPPPECEVIDLDDDTSEQATENDLSPVENHSTMRSPEESLDNTEKNCAVTKDTSNNSDIRNIESDKTESSTKPAPDENIAGSADLGNKKKSSDSNKPDDNGKPAIKTYARNKKDNQSSEKTNENKEELKSKTDLNASCNDIFSENNVITSVISSTTTSDSDHSDSKNQVKKKRLTKKSSTKTDSTSNKNLKKSNNSSGDDSDIEKLLNTKSLENKICLEREKSQKNKNSKQMEGSEMTEKECKKTKKSILDYYNEDSDDSVIDLKGEMDIIIIKEKPLDRKGILGLIRSSDFLKEEYELSSLESDTDNNKSYDSEGLLKDSDDERNEKKKNKDKKDSNENEKKSGDSAEDDECKTPEWKKDKLLTMKISDESEDDPDVFKKKKTSKSENRAKKSTAILSDSDVEIVTSKNKNSSESHGDSSSEEEEVKSKKKRKRIKNASSSSADENDAVEGSGGKGYRKNIRKVLKKDSLQEATQNALKEEEERKKRIIERQKLYNLMMEECENTFSKTIDKLVLDFDIDTKQEIISVDKDLVTKLKPHQAEGVKFMWDSCFETVKKAKKGKGSGCILAHCMGLGKTLQVVTLVHTILMNDVGVKCALILCPLSTVLNWVNEFEKWLSNVGSGQDVDVFHLTKANANYRASQLREWQRRGGALILGYNLFRLLVNPTKRIKASIKNTYLETLVDPGPDLVICDEGHLLKNEKTALSKAVEKFKALRRIVLTGTPLQNNLNEYHCMMQFVKPNLLGTRKEFINRFVNPIENGQFVDSTPQDVKIMKRRAHVLHKMLDGVVQRKAYNVLVPFLPIKHEYVLSLGLTDVQVKLYQHYLENFSRNSTTAAGTSLFKDRNMLGLICAHPRLLIVQKENELLKRDMEESDEEGSLKDFIDDSTSDSSSSPSESDDDSSKSSTSTKGNERDKRSSRRNKINENNEEVQEEAQKDGCWWSSIIGDNDLDDIGSSTKLFLLFTILQKCEEIGDKVLVFTQSLLVLDIIEYFLDIIDTQSHNEDPPVGLKGFKGTWIKGIDYFRLDGKTSSENRTNWCKQFNRDDNYRSRLFLISTRAGGLGINLTGANRVVLFDASWNPSHDVQSIFRIYRFGQSKPCYIYRFLNKGTMEQKVYDRQVTKLSMSCRVIDEQQIDRHFSFADLNELYAFTPNERDGETPPLPKDRLLAELLQEHKEALLWYHTHDSLLENQIDEELNEEERKQAWADFENEKKPQAQHMMNSNFADLYQRAYTALKEKYPNWQEQELRQGTMAVLMKLNPMYNQPQMQTGLVQQQQPIIQNRMPMQHNVALQGAPNMFPTQLPYNMGQRFQNITPFPRNPNAFGNMQRNFLPNPFATSKVLPNPLNKSFNPSMMKPGPSNQMYRNPAPPQNNPSSSTNK